MDTVGTLIAGVLVLGILFLAIRSMVRKRREGKRVLCGNCEDCKNCGGQLCSRGKR